MTEEQLKRGNEIAEKINELKMFYEFFAGAEIARTDELIIESERYTDVFLENTKCIVLNIKKYPDLKQIIEKYLTDKIGELERQLEEL